MVVLIISWLLLGAIVGFVASKLVDLRGDEPLIGIAAAVAGAVILGVINRLRVGEGVVAWDVSNIVATILGAAVGVTVYHLIRSRSIGTDKQTVRSSY